MIWGEIDAAACSTWFVTLFKRKNISIEPTVVAAAEKASLTLLPTVYWAKAFTNALEPKLIVTFIIESTLKYLSSSFQI